MADHECAEVITINGSASYGDDPVPLFEAGEARMACVLQIEALGQIMVSSALTKSKEVYTGGDATFGGVKLMKAIIKYQISASSGQAYYVSTMTAIGRHDG